MLNLSRDLLARFLGMGNTKINVDVECDYPTTVSVEDYDRMISRGGIANRVNTIYAEHCWEVDPLIYEDEDTSVETEFEKQLKQLEQDHGLYSLFEQADADAGIGNYGIILIGIDDGLELDQEVKGITGKDTDQTSKKHTLLYIRSFSMKHAIILEYEEDKTNSRYGSPTLYQVNLETIVTASGSVPKTTTKAVKVHWTRVIHVCHKPGKENFHTPSCEPVYNHLLDLRKNYGGSAQMTWQGGFPGIAFEPANTDKDVSYELDPDAIKSAMDSYSRGLSRYLAVEGFVPKTLPVQVYDPTAPIEVQLKAVALIKGVPYRIFLGTEEAQLAGTQDQKNWDRRIKRRQTRICTPRIVRPVIDRFISLGILARPVEDYYVEYSDRGEATREQKVETGARETEALARYASGGVESVIPLREYLTLFLGRDEDEVDLILEERTKQEDLLADQEADDIANGIDPMTGLPIQDPAVDPATGLPIEDAEDGPVAPTPPPAADNKEKGQKFPKKATKKAPKKFPKK